jgi:hypothetical protein
MARDKHGMKVIMSLEGCGMSGYGLGVILIIFMKTHQ